MKSVGNDVSHSATRGCPFVERGDPRYRFLFGKEVSMLKKRKPQSNNGVTNKEDQDPGCDRFNRGMMERGDSKMMIGIQWPKLGV